MNFEQGSADEVDPIDESKLGDLVADTGGLSRRTAMIIALAATAAFAVRDVFAAEPALATTVSATDQANAQALLASGRVSFGHWMPKAQIEAYAAGYKYVGVDGRDCHINGVILAALKTVVIDRGFTIAIGSLNRYCENAGNTYSYHYRDGGGRAVDIYRVNGVQSTGGTAQDLALINAMTSIIPTPAGLGQSTCAGHNVTLPPNWAHFPDGCNHNHFEYRGANEVLPNQPPQEPEDDMYDNAARDALFRKIENDTRPIRLYTWGTGVIAVGPGGKEWVVPGQAYIDLMVFLRLCGPESVSITTEQKNFLTMISGLLNPDPNVNAQAGGVLNLAPEEAERLARDLPSNA